MTVLSMFVREFHLAEPSTEATAIGRDSKHGHPLSCLGQPAIIASKS